MPVVACPGAPDDCCVVAIASTVAPPTIATAPPITLAQSLAFDPCSSRNRRHPQASPTRLFVFQSGNAIASPTLRTAKMVSVFPTAHNMPPSTAHTIRCGLSRRSLNRNPVPFSNVGTVQRATNAPITMPIEMMNGEKPSFTSFVGASALPSHTAAARPQKTPSWCSDMVDRADPPVAAAVAAPLAFFVRFELTGALPQGHQQRGSQNQHHHRHPEMQIGENAHQFRSVH